jgi:hypothetical protein
VCVLLGATLDANYYRETADFLRFYALLMTFLLIMIIKNTHWIVNGDVVTATRREQSGSKRTINIHIEFFKHPNDA